MCGKAFLGLAFLLEGRAALALIPTVLLERLANNAIHPHNHLRKKRLLFSLPHHASSHTCWKTTTVGNNSYLYELRGISHTNDMRTTPSTSITVEQPEPSGFQTLLA
ncbi:hypothetical protein VTK56DRAFT_5638 [Thermocarpiscus australiensis]